MLKNKKNIAISIAILSIFSVISSFYINFQDKDDYRKAIKFDKRDIKSNDKLLSIVTWNLKGFGEKKIKDKETLEFVIEVIKRFDIISIQEYRGKKDFVPLLMRELNFWSGKTYKYIISKPIGRTRFKERYIVIYNNKKLKLKGYEVFPDYKDEFHREPLIAWFKKKDNTFDFYLINIHTDPDLVDKEITSMASVIKYIYSKNKTERDLIICGDLNADNKYIDNLIKTKFSSFLNLGYAVILPAVSNLKRDKLYDNFIFYPKYTKEFSGSGVINYDKELGLSYEKAKKVSDHLPVFAIFYSEKDDD